MTDLQEAPGELVALAVRMRPDWHAEDLGDALFAAKQAGWSWDARFREIIRLLVRPDGYPAELREACRRPAALPPALTGPVRPGGDGLPKAEEVRALLDKARDDSHAATSVVRNYDPPRNNIA